MKPDYVSYSRMGLFKQCQRKYFYRYIAQLPEAFSAAREAGKVVHEALELIALGQEDHREAARIAYEKSPLKDVPSIVQGQSAKQMVWSHIVTAIAAEDNVALDGIEMTLTAEYDGVKMLGMADRVDADGTIVDYKTGARRVEHRDQIAFYGLLRDGLEEPSRGRLVYTKTGHVKDVRVTIQAKEMIKNRAVEFHSEASAMPQLESGWATNPTRLCNWCDFQEVCPDSPGKRNQPIRERIAALKEELKQIKSLEAET